jgi:type I restriction enzyme S subunit
VTLLKTENIETAKPLPKGWHWVLLGEVCEFTYGSSLPETVRKKGVVPVYGSNGIVGYHDKSVTHSPTLIIGRKGSIGEVNYSQVPCWPIDTTYYVDDSKTSCNLDWLFFLLKFMKLSTLNKASGVPGLNRDDVYNQKIPFPQLAEQERLARVLNEQMAAVEKARAAAEARLEAAKALPAAYLREVFGSDEAKNWRRTQLGQICEIIAGQSPPGETYNRELVGLPFFQGKADFGQLHPAVRVWCSKPIKISLPDDILISVRAPVGPTNVANIKCCIGRGLAAIRCGGKVNKDFVLWVLKLFELQLSRLGSGSTFTSITTAELKNFGVPIPATLQEQERIANGLNEQIAIAEHIKVIIETELESIDSLPTALLRQAFSGGL